MKKLLLSALCGILLFPISGNAAANYQIEKRLKQTSYDSLENFRFHKTLEDYYKYVGQEILFFITVNDYILGDNAKLLIPDTVWRGKSLNPRNTRNYRLMYKYGWEHNDFNDPVDLTNSKAFAGGVFTIRGVKPYYSRWCLILSPKDNPDKLFSYHFEDYYHFENPPFVIMGYFEKIKKSIGKKYICKINSKPFKKTDVNSEEDIIYTVEDVTFYKNNNFYLPAVIFSDREGNRFPASLIEYPYYNSIGMESRGWPGERWTSFAHFQEYTEYLDEIKKKNDELAKSYLEVIGGKKFITAKEGKYNGLNDNEIIYVPKGVTFTCTGIQSAARYDIWGILENEKYGKIRLPVDYLATFTTRENFKKEGYRYIDSLGSPVKSMIDAKHESELKRKFGESKTSIIVKGRVRIGFTQDMCIEAWGLPIDISTTVTNDTTKEVWIYNTTRSITFINGIVTTIQF